MVGSTTVTIDKMNGVSKRDSNPWMSLTVSENLNQVQIKKNKENKERNNLFGVHDLAVADNDKMDVDEDSCSLRLIASEYPFKKLISLS
jgi:hypothetical protein